MNYHTIVLIHRILVSAFLFHYLWKTFLLLSNKSELLKNYTAKTRIAEMVISLLFLATGFWLLMQGAALTTLQYLKLAMVFASIPIAIVGFKKANKGLAVLAVLLIIGAYGLAEINKKKTHTVVAPATANDGRELYNNNCARCHGENGDAQLAGAADLSHSALSDDEKKNAILHGKGNMQPIEGLTDEQATAIVGYIDGLKK
ncbi:MAG: c-type cytochrome [Chitinophagales bacterium]